MKKAVRNLFNEANNNEEFKAEMKKIGEGDFARPSKFWDVELKAIFASVYMGWLMGRGEYKEENYD
jgi:hypothetical protein